MAGSVVVLVAPGPGSGIGSALVRPSWPPWS